MPSILSFVVNIDKDKVIFFPGQVVSGTITLILLKPLRMNSVRARIHGGTNTRVRYRDGNEIRVACDKEKFIEKVITLHGSDQGEKFEQYPTLPEGRYDYKFSFKLPKSGLPSSYEGINGNYIRYFVEASIHLPWKKLEPKARKAFTVIELIDCNKIEHSGAPEMLENETTICCWWCRSGPITLTAEIDKKAICAGENILLVKAEIDNCSNRTLHGIKVDFKQIIKQKASVHIDVHEKSYHKESFDEAIEPHRKLTFEDVVLNTPCISPTNVSSKILKVEYVLRVYISIPFEPNLAVNFPIVLGTVPTRIKIGLASNSAPKITRAPSTERFSQLQNSIIPKPFDRGRHTKKDSKKTDFKGLIPPSEAYLPTVTTESCLYCAAGYPQLESKTDSQKLNIGRETQIDNTTQAPNSKDTPKTTDGNTLLAASGRPLPSVSTETCLYCAAGYPQLHRTASVLQSTNSLETQIDTRDRVGSFIVGTQGIPPPTYEPCCDGMVDISDGDGDYIGDTFFVPLYPVLHPSF